VQISTDLIKAGLSGDELSRKILEVCNERQIKLFTDLVDQRIPEKTRELLARRTMAYQIALTLAKEFQEAQTAEEAQFREDLIKNNPIRSGLDSWLTDQVDNKVPFKFPSCPYFLLLLLFFTELLHASLRRSLALARARSLLKTWS